MKKKILWLYKHEGKEGRKEVIENTVASFFFSLLKNLSKWIYLKGVLLNERTNGNRRISGTCRP